MTNEIIKEKEYRDIKVTSGDIVACDDGTKWLAIRLENNKFICYDLETHKYMEVRDEEGAYVTLKAINNTLGSRYGCKDLHPQLLKAEDIDIEIVVSK
jgi:hypothetical protein